MHYNAWRRAKQYSAMIQQNFLGFVSLVDSDTTYFEYFLELLYYERGLLSIFLEIQN